MEEDTTIMEKIRDWIKGISIVSNAAYKETITDGDSGMVITSTSDDPGISISSSGSSAVEAAGQYLDIDEEAIKKMYTEIGKGYTRTITSACLSPGAGMYDTYKPVEIKPVGSEIKIDDKVFDDIGDDIGDWLIGDCADVKIKDCSDVKITDFRPTDSFDDPIREGTRFIETVNKSPEPKPVPTKDTEFTRLWGKLDSI